MPDLATNLKWAAEATTPPLDVDGSVIEPADAEADSADAAGGSGGDAGTTIGGCTAPTLLVLVHSVDGSSRVGGHVLQYALGGGAPVRCGRDISGQGTLPGQLYSVAWIPPDAIAVLDAHWAASRSRRSCFASWR